jgi:hypothetical protein
MLGKVQEILLGTTSSASHTALLWRTRVRIVYYM